jgi:histidinol-phosphate aminotransferase
VAHGAISPAEIAARGLAAERLIDFSVNSNPLGPSPAAIAAVQALGAAQIGRYPDPEVVALRRALGEQLDLATGQIVVGNGSSELIWLVALAYARPAPEGVLIVGPTFGEYERACRLTGTAIQVASASPAERFAPDVDATAATVRAARPRVVWLCNPNNPTGLYLRRAQIARVLDACVVAGALLVVDEAYLAFVREPDSLLSLLDSEHLLLLRSLTKDYALTGLRLGCALAAPAIVRVLLSVQPPWSVNAAQAVGVAALADAAHLARAQREVWTARAALLAGLARLRLQVPASPAANFVLVRVGDAAAFRHALLHAGCVVRDCTSFGLPEYVRLGVRTRAECETLLARIAEVWRPQLPGRVPEAVS